MVGEAGKDQPFSPEEKKTPSPQTIAQIWEIRASTAVSHWVTRYVAEEWYIDKDKLEGHLSLPSHLVNIYSFATTGLYDEEKALIKEHKRLLADFSDKAHNLEFLNECTQAMQNFATEDLRGLKSGDLSHQLSERKGALTSEQTRGYFQFFCQLRMAERWLNLLAGEESDNVWQKYIDAQAEELSDKIKQRLDWISEKDKELAPLVKNLFTVPLIYNPLLLLTPDAEFPFGFMTKLGMETPAQGLPEAQDHAGYFVRKPLQEKERILLIESAKEPVPELAKSLDVSWGKS